MAGKTDAKEAIAIYLKQQNRPYSANDITLNLHKEFGKTAVQKALDELSAKGMIQEKTYGKQKVYAPLQDTTDQQTLQVALLELDSQITDSSDKLSKIEQELKALEAELKEFSNQTSTEEALEMEKTLSASVERLKSKINKISVQGEKVSVEEKNEIVKKSENISKEYRKRKRICMEIANAILENYPKSKKVFFEEVGIETDESATM